MTTLSPRTSLQTTLCAHSTATQSGAGATALPSISPYAAHLALLGEPAPSVDVVAEPVLAQAQAQAPALAIAPAAASTRRDVVVRDGVAGFVAGVFVLSLVLVAAASFAATQA